MKLKATLMAASAMALTAFAPASAEEVQKIGLAVANLQADYFNQIKLGVEAYATEKGIEVITVDAKNDGATQVSQVQDLLAQGIDAFIYIPRRGCGCDGARAPCQGRGDPGRQCGPQCRRRTRRYLHCDRQCRLGL